MDGGTFDRLTRLLAGRLTRRTGLAGAVAALTAGGSAAGLAPEARARRRRGPERAPEPGRAAEDRGGEVFDEKKPCGPKPKDNRCRKHKDCCTKYCKPPKGKQKIGRCRCVKPGKKCKNGQKCCGGSTCQNRKCTPATGPTCAAAGAACTADAACCAGLVCQAGSCAPCVETVCASGCAFTNVNDAYEAAVAGATIYVGKGTYPTAIIVTKDITIAACPGVTGVVLQPDRKLKGFDDNYAIMVEDVTSSDEFTVTLRNIGLAGSAPTNVDEALLNATKNGNVNFTIESCTAANAMTVISAQGGAQNLSRLSATSCGHVVLMSGAPSGSVTVEDSQFSAGLDSYVSIYAFEPTQLTMAVSGTTITNTYGGIYLKLLQQGSMTVTNTTMTGLETDPLGFVGVRELADRTKTTATITNVTIDDCEYGPTFVGGIINVNNSAFTNNGDTYGFVDISNTTLTLTDTRISGNKSDDGAGGGIQASCSQNFPLILTFAGTTAVEGNAVSGAGGGLSVAKFTGSNGCGGLTFTNVTTTTVKNNTATGVGPQCAICTASGTCGNNDWVDVPTCTFT